jgi:hypothetical protein
MIESLIKKFIQHLNDVEGTDFLHASNLTSEDVALLKKVRDGGSITWQPIETAPKDHHVLLWLPEPWNRFEKAIWCEAWDSWVEDQPTASELVKERYGIGSAVPTHWMEVERP